MAALRTPAIPVYFIVKIIFVLTLNSLQAADDPFFSSSFEDCSKEPFCTPLTTYEDDIHPLLEADCERCHRRGAGGYTVNDDVAVSYASAVLRVDLGDPESSLILQKASGTVDHDGGEISGYALGEENYLLVLKWIDDGVLE